MSKHRTQSKLEKILSLADIKTNNHRPWDICVYNENFYRRVLSQGSLGLGESYMDHWWDCQKLDQFFYKVIRADLDRIIKHNLYLFFNILRAKLLNLQNYKRAYQVGEKHYDLGNDLYKSMLDRRMVYSCGYWRNAATLDEAQQAKLELICKKLGLKQGMKILDIGCGWGSFAKYAAEKYGVRAVGVTISEQQAKLGRELCRGLPVEIRLEDYRQVKEKFDHIVSLGMFEHVGYKNYKTYMRVADRCLKHTGLFLLQTIGRNKSKKHNDPWLEKYIFPNSLVPSEKQIKTAIGGLFIIKDWHNFGTDYYKTLMCWYENFVANWEKIKSNYDEKFYRMWKYYLLACAGSFRAKKSQLWQIVFSKEGITQNYQPVR
jgi:cyclopropane-fatty-acyl-phospholipid synthase